MAERMRETSRMRLHFVPVRYKGKVTLPDSLLEKLPKKIILFTTIQYHNQMTAWMKALAAAGKEVHTFKPKHSAVEGQLLGCGVEHWAVKADAFLFIGDGLFHPTALVIKNHLPVYCYNPQTRKHNILNDKDIELAKRKQEAALKRFHMATKIGVLVTTKSGQQRVAMALKLREQFPEKEFTFLLYDSLDFASLEDFPFLECFINTMCPRIGLDDTNKLEKPVLDISELGFEW